MNLSIVWKDIHVQDSFTLVLIQIVDAYICWTFTLWETLKTQVYEVIMLYTPDLL